MSVPNAESIPLGSITTDLPLLSGKSSMICSIVGAAATLVIACNNIGDIILSDISAKTYSFGNYFFYHY